MHIREITNQHHYPRLLFRFPRLIYIHYSILRILFLRSRVCRRALKNLLLKINPVESHILDAGCGEGQYIIPLAAQFPSISFTGIDQLPSHISFLEKLSGKNGLANCTFEKADIETFRTTTSFELIFLIGVLQYTSRPAKLLEFLGQSQKAGQQLLLYTPIQSNIHFNFYRLIRKKYGHYDDAQPGYHPIEESVLKAWVAKAGYQVTHEEYNYGPAATLGHEIMQSLIILITHWPNYLKFIPCVFFIILMPIFVPLQVVDTWIQPRRGNGLLLILQK